MAIARSLLLRASRSRWLATQLRERSFMRRAVRRFMPGEELPAALDASEALAREGLGTVLTQLGENITTRAEADAVRDHYLGVFAELRRRGLRTQVSVKPTQLGLDVDEAGCLERTRILASAAEEHGSILFIDMEDSIYVDRTLAMYRALIAERPNVGICLQSYLHRTPADLDALLPLRPAIRLVKGAYREPPTVAFPRKADVDAAYARLSGKMLESVRGKDNEGAGRMVFGTHDIDLIGNIRRQASELGVPRGAWEVHMLYGIRTGEQHRLAAAGVPVRCLISYGRAWFAWYMRRLAERPANVWFVVKSIA